MDAERVPLAIDVAFEPGLASTCLERARAVGDGDAMVVVAVDVLVAGSFSIAQVDAGTARVELVHDAEDREAVAAIEPSRVAASWHEPLAFADTASIFAPDLARLVRIVHPQLDGAELRLGGLVNVRPLTAQLAARTELRRVLFVCAGDAGRVASDDVIVVGGLIRTLLEELDHGPQLSDAAGIAVSLTSGTAERAGIEIADQARRLLRQPDGQRVIGVCAQRDTVATIPWLMVRDDQALVAGPTTPG